jgi:hypothetical protein
MNSSEVPDNQKITVDEFIAHGNTQDGGLEGEMVYSVNAEGQIEILFWNGIYHFSPEEFEQLKAKTPQSQWKEYPNDWAPDEIDEVVDYLNRHDLVQSLRDDHDFAGALNQVKIHLSADEQDGGEDFPAWARQLDTPDMDMLARGVLKVLGIAAPKVESETPEGMVDRLLGG